MNLGVRGSFQPARVAADWALIIRRQPRPMPRNTFGVQNSATPTALYSIAPGCGCYPGRNSKPALPPVGSLRASR